MQDSVAQQEREDGGSMQNTDLEKRYTNYLDAERLDNESLSVLGNSLLGTFALEWLENRYPHLPER
jgi:dsRNA-specific ribonuclease